MKVNKMIYIDYDTLKEMMKYCDEISEKNKAKGKKELKISALIETMWKEYRRVYK